MKITITVMSGNRDLCRALSRVDSFASGVQRECLPLDTATEPYDVLQIIVCDQPETHLNRIGRQRDRIYQIEVGTPHGLTFRPSDDVTFVGRLANQIVRALEIVPMSETNKRAALAAVEARRVVFGEHAATAVRS